MKSEKILVLTGTSDILRSSEETDATMQEVFNLTLPSKQRYVKKHGYDLLCLQSFGSNETNGFQKTHIGFMRLLKAFEMLNYYDIVMWIDADSLITNLDYKLQDFQLDEQNCFYASWDWTGKETISTGNFILKKTEKINEFLNAVIQVGKYIIETNQWGQEQTTINLIYRNTNLNNKIKILDHSYLNGVPLELMEIDCWKNRQKINYPWNNKHFLAHITGISNTDRINIINNIFKDYL